MSPWSVVKPLIEVLVGVLADVTKVGGEAPRRSVGEGDVDVTEVSDEAPCRSVSEGDADVTEVPLPKCWLR